MSLSSLLLCLHCLSASSKLIRSSCARQLEVGQRRRRRFWCTPQTLHSTMATTTPANFVASLKLLPPIWCSTDGKVVASSSGRHNYAPSLFSFSFLLFFFFFSHSIYSNANSAKQNHAVPSTTGNDDDDGLLIPLSVRFLVVN